MSVLNPAAEFDYAPRVRELFMDLRHAAPPMVDASNCLIATVGEREQGVAVCFWVDARQGVIGDSGYQAYGCPHFLAACESAARWLLGQPLSALERWSWRELEVELALPASKRARLLVLQDALRALQAATDNG